jgi:uracil-DNA glycosylase family 4
MSGKSDIFDLAILTRKALKQCEEIGAGVPEVDRAVLDRMNFTCGSGDKRELLTQFKSEIENCTMCRLHAGRNKFVFGVGNPNADVMFIGEGPGRDEDMKGEPFVGRAGQLLDKILAAIKFDRTIVYIGNVVKCRPPGNRDPQGDEMTTCMPYLERQIEIIQPKLICCLGRISAQALLRTTTPLGRLRKKFHDFRGIKLMVTYHPAALLRFQQYKRDTWEDVQMLRAEYDRIIAER